MHSDPKILAIQFKYFGDAVLMTPALRAIREDMPDCELHVLAPEEVTPLFEHLPWLNRVWAMPRRRGRGNLSETLPIIRALRRERFDKSVDFASNDRGAIASLLIGACDRLGWEESGGFWGRRFCYYRRVAPESKPLHESAHLVHLLSGWSVPPPRSLESEIHADPSLAETAKRILPAENAIICHVASSQPKKEWPLRNWVALHRMATRAGRNVVFTTARGEREESLMTELSKLAPDAVILPLINDLPALLAVLRRAALFISGDTGPLHFAAGLGVPTISLFGPSPPGRWAPIGPMHTFLIGSQCGCDGNSAVCTGQSHCVAAISPEQVWEHIRKFEHTKFRSPD
ncbi:MAG TPA: glycosyltransferase family 9 protein [Candidatus Acidoferrales bacterium]|jgi:heptosyltransferase-3|nr:glycosyltransferase family 9 protein [Candidatus Acidoferrales bacterium]